MSSLFHEIQDEEQLLPRNDQQYITVVSRKMAPTLQYMCALGYSHPDLYKAVFGFETRQEPYYDSWRHIFVDRVAMNFELEQTLKALERSGVFGEDYCAV